MSHWDRECSAAAGGFSQVGHGLCGGNIKGIVSCISRREEKAQKTAVRIAVNASPAFTSIGGLKKHVAAGTAEHQEYVIRVSRSGALDSQIAFRCCAYHGHFVETITCVFAHMKSAEPGPAGSPGHNASRQHFHQGQFPGRVFS